MKRKGEVHDEAAKGAVPRWVGQGQEGSRRLLAPALNGKKGRRAGGGARVKGSWGQGEVAVSRGGKLWAPFALPCWQRAFWQGRK